MFHHIFKIRQSIQFIAKVRNLCTFKAKSVNTQIYPPPPPPSIWEFPGGLIASFMSLFRFSSPTNDFQAIDTAESINLPLSLDEQITRKKILEEHITPKSEIILTELKSYRCDQKYFIVSEHREYGNIAQWQICYPDGNMIEVVYNSCSHCFFLLT